LDVEAARIEHLRKPIDHRPLAGGGPTLEKQDDRHARFLNPSLHTSEPRGQRRKHAAILFLGDLFVEIE
jgi:hypothetical protein